MRITVLEYVDSQGESPFRAWLLKLDRPVAARVQARIQRFESGNLGDHKSVGQGVWGARMPFGAGYRVYFGKQGSAIVLLLLGGDKGSQTQDIERAKRLWKDFLEEDSDGEAE
jgi:putative addiction module killer protein